jgi:hypothetical protein
MYKIIGTNNLISKEVIESIIKEIFGDIFEDTKELCNLANELNDRKTLFRVGCNGN